MREDTKVYPVLGISWGLYPLPETSSGYQIPHWKFIVYYSEVNSASSVGSSPEINVIFYDNVTDDADELFN